MKKAINSEVAKKSDYDEVFSILVSTAEWLKERGSEQWGDLLKGVDVHRTDRAIENQNVYMTYEKETLIGIFILLEKQSAWDQHLWGKDSNEDTVYLHRVALSRHAHGNGNGEKLVEAAINVAQNKGKNIMRLDCIATNVYLNSFYASLGFEMIEKHKSNKPASESTFNLYQKKL